MSHSHSTASGAKRDERGRSPFKGAALASVIACFLILLSCSRQPVHTSAPVEGDSISIAVKALTNDVPSFYTYKYDGKNISFMVLKREGTVMSFLDACAKCYPKKLGYDFEDGYLICNACNESYIVDEMETGFGNCFPIRLEGRVEGDRYIIPLLNLEKMAGKF